MEHVHKGKKTQSAARVFETTLGTPGKTAKNSGTVTAGVTLFSYQHKRIVCFLLSNNVLDLENRF